MGRGIRGVPCFPLSPLSLQSQSSMSWLSSQDEAALSSSCALRAHDKGTGTAGAPTAPEPNGRGHSADTSTLTVPYEVYRADHSCLVTVLPVNASVRDVLQSLTPQLGWDGEHLLVKVNSAGGERWSRGTPGSLS